MWFLRKKPYIAYSYFQYQRQIIESENCSGKYLGRLGVWLNIRVYKCILAWLRYTPAEDSIHS